MAYLSTILKPNAIFMETHEDPDKAPSDGPNMIKLQDMPEIIHKIRKLSNVV